MPEESAFGLPLFARVTDNTDNEPFYDVGDLCLVTARTGEGVFKAFFLDTGLFWHIELSMLKFLNLKEGPVRETK